MAEFAPQTPFVSLWGAKQSDNLSYSSKYK